MRAVIIAFLHQKRTENKDDCKESPWGSHTWKHTCGFPSGLTCDLHWLHESTYVSVSLLTVWITAILLTIFVLVEWELSCKDEILFTFVSEWLRRERKHGANRCIIVMQTVECQEVKCESLLRVLSWPNNMWSFELSWPQIDEINQRLSDNNSDI